MKINWKIIAIIVLTLFIAENLLIGYSLWSVEVEDHKINICYYDICSDYPDAEYSGDVCFCYEYDVLGNLVIGESEYMK